MSKKANNNSLSKEQQKQINSAVAKAKGNNKKQMSAQDSIPFQRMFKDGICRVTDNFYSKTVKFLDINYQLNNNEDKNAIFDAWCDFLNYFDSSVKFQLSFMNMTGAKETYSENISIPVRGDMFDGIAIEYQTFLRDQLAKGNNGLIKTKYLTFGIEAESLRIAKPRLERLELDILTNFKKMGVIAEPINGYERLKLMHGMFHLDEKIPFRFSWNDLVPSGLSVKDYIAPSSFEFRNGTTFGVGKKVGAVSFLQILAPELNDRLLADFLDMETNLIVSMHIQSVDQVSAIKTVKRKITDLQKMKIEEQKKAVRSGYDMDIIPSDLATYNNEASKLLQDLQSRNERMFLLTFIVMNVADTKQQLDNTVFQASSIAQKYNCQLTRLDFQQEQGLMSCLPLGYNQIEIQRGLTTSSVAIFIPFTTQELFQTSKEALYCGLNALSNNLIMVDRKLLKNPNGLILGTPGCFVGATKFMLSDSSTVSFAEMVEKGITTTTVKSFDEEKNCIVNAKAKDIRIEKYADEIYTFHLLDGSAFSCTDTHLIMDKNGDYISAKDITEGQMLSGNHTVIKIVIEKLSEEIPVYDMTVPKYMNFILENGLIVHNSGKSFSAKREISNVFFVTDDDIIICDPESEYGALVERLDGQVIKISPTSDDYINPMDLNLNYSEDENPLTLKSDFILSLCELIVAGKDGLQPVEKTIIDRCVRQVYRDYLLNPVPENMPILEDLYNELRKQEEKEAQYIATALEIYVTGSLNVFNHRTNVDIKSRVVSYDIKELGKQLKKIGMLIVQDQVWNRVTVNREAHKSTRYYIDEMHLLLKEEQTAAYTVEIWKRFRKWGGIPTGITQNVKDLLSSREIENIFENSDYIYMLNQASGDRQILAKQLNISPHQLSYVTQSGEGEGLIFYGSTILPFTDRFPKDTELYKIMTTKPQEKAV